MNTEQINQIINSIQKYSQFSEELKQFATTKEIEQKINKLSQQLLDSLELSKEIQDEMKQEEIKRMKKLEQEEKRRKEKEIIEKNRIIPKFTKESHKLYQSVFKQLFNQVKEPKVKVLMDVNMNNEYSLKYQFWKTLYCQQNVFITVELPNKGLIGWYIYYFVTEKINNNLCLDTICNHFFFIIKPQTKDLIKFDPVKNSTVKRDYLFVNNQNQSNEFFNWQKLFSLSSDFHIHLSNTINQFDKLYKIPKTQNTFDLIDFLTKENNQLSFNRLIAFSLSKNDVEALTTEKFLERIKPN